MPLFAFDDAECAALAYGKTPLFAYRALTVQESYLNLRAAMPDRVVIAYAVKSNPHHEILKLLARLGASFDCASIGELRGVLDLGPLPDRVYFAGPGKRTEEIDAAIAHGVRIQAEGFEDLERIDLCAEARRIDEVVVNLRVHPKDGVSENNRIIGGSGPSAFGIDEEDLPEVLDRVKALRRVRIGGLHVFAASNERNAARLAATHGMVFRMARRIADDFGITIDMIDVGGGLGIPYTESESTLDLAALGASMRRLLAEHAWFRGKVVMEPGRFISGPCGIYLARVIREKQSRGTRFVILEGGINHLLRPHLVGQPFPVRAIRASGRIAAQADAPTTRAVLAGPLCTSLDRLGEVDLPPTSPGDLLAFGSVGAYGFTEGMTHFLSHPVPQEIWVDI